MSRDLGYGNYLLEQIALCEEGLLQCRRELDEAETDDEKEEILKEIETLERLMTEYEESYDNECDREINEGPEF